MNRTSKTTTAKSLRRIGYVSSVVVGLTFWPSFMRLGFAMQNSNSGLAILFVWFCIPLTLLAVYGVSYTFMNWAATFEHWIGGLQFHRYVRFSCMLGVLATLGSCALLTAGVQPPEPVFSFYDMRVK